MKAEKVTVKYERKFDVGGDYSSFSVSVMPTIIIEEGEDLNDALDDILNVCKLQVAKAAVPILSKYGIRDNHISQATIKELYLGKEVTNAD